MTTLKLVLFDLDEAGLSDWDADDTADSRVNTGFFLSTLVCGSSLCFAADRSFPLFQRSGKAKAWDVEWSGSSGLRFGAALSAFAEATQMSTLALRAELDEDMNYDSLYWAWLAYAFWTRGSRFTIQDLTISWINLTEAHVAAVKKVLACSFPEPIEIPSTASSGYGYVDIKKGTELHFGGRGAGNSAALILAKDCRCRARYDSSSQFGVADVVVPGYGICRVVLGANTTFVPDTLGLAMTGSSCGIRCLRLALDDVENNSVLPQLLKLLGKGLQTLSLNFGCVADRPASLNLSAVALACPELKELRLQDWNVCLGDELEALEAWSIKKLSIRGSSKVDGLASCLGNRVYRMASELVELEISPTRIGRGHEQIEYDHAYVVSLMKHNGEVLPVTKMKFPKDSKSALISVVSGKSGNLQAMQYLDTSILSIIFAFAATPQSRVVQVAQ